MALLSVQGSGQASVTEFSTEWKIPMFFPLDVKYKEVRGPVFQYLGVKWRIDIRKKDDFWELFIVKDVLCPSFLWAYYTIGIKKADGTVYKSQCGKILVGVFDNLGRTKNFVRPSDLQRDKTEIAPQDALVVFCNLCTKENPYERTLSNTVGETEKCSYRNEYNITEKKGVQKKSSENFRDIKATSDVLSGLLTCSQNMKDIFLSGLFSDVTIKVNNEEFRVHRVILAARSPVLSAMMQHDMEESRTGNIYIKDCSPGAFREFLEYLYTGKTEGLTRANICEVYKMADKYDIRQLVSDCKSVLSENLSVDFFCDTVSLSAEYADKKLMEYAAAFFLQNMKNILATSQWQSFMQENPKLANELFLQVANKTKNI